MEFSIRLSDFLPKYLYHFELAWCNNDQGVTMVSETNILQSPLFRAQEAVITERSGLGRAT